MTYSELKTAIHKATTKAGIEIGISINKEQWMWAIRMNIGLEITSISTLFNDTAKALGYGHITIAEAATLNAEINEIRDGLRYLKTAMDIKHLKEMLNSI